MATLVQFKTASAFSGTSFSLTMTSPLTAGNALMVGYDLDAVTLSAVITDGTNTYVPGTTTAVGGGKVAGRAHALNIASGSPTITITVSGGTIGNCTLWVEEWSGIPAGSFDGDSSLYTSSGGASGVTFFAGSITTTAAGDFIWAFGYSPANGVPPNIGSGFTTGTTDGPSAFQSEFQTQVAAGAINPSFVTSATNAFDLFAVAAAFKAAGGGGPTGIIGLASSEW